MITIRPKLQSTIGGWQLLANETSATTISRFRGKLFTEGLMRPMIYIPLTVGHTRSRLKWCSQHQPRTWAQEANFIFADESLFSVNNEFRYFHIWREPGSRYHSSNIMYVHHYDMQCYILSWRDVGWAAQTYTYYRESSQLL